MKQFDKIRGTFDPVRTDDLCAGTKEYIGMQCIWECLWIIEEGRYINQWAMSPDNKQNLPFAWAPECDIVFE